MLKEKVHLIVRFIMLMAAVSLLAACGGGGGGDTGGTQTYTIGGTVSGLTGAGLVLQDNGADDLDVTTNGSFVFAAPVADGSVYVVTVRTQPAGQTCTVNNGAGIVSGASPSNISVVCGAGGGTSSITGYTGTITFDLTTGASGTADVTWTKFEDLGDTRRYLPSGTMLVDFNVQGCDPLLAQSIPIETSTPANPLETLVVYTSTNAAYPKQYQFTLNGDSNYTVTLTCSGQSVQLPASALLPIMVSGCVGPPFPSFTDETVLSGSLSCAQTGLTSASWTFTAQ
jgi:hypothetical protein